MPGDNASIPILRPGEDTKLEGPRPADSTSVKLYNDINQSVVRIETAHSVGSGFAVGKSGQILTNFHCVSGDDEVFVRSADGQRYRARIKSADDVKDLALLEIEGKAPDSLKPLTLGDDKSLKPSQQINAIGHPDGSAQNYLSPGTFAEQTNNIKRFNTAMVTAFSKLDFDPLDKTNFLHNDLLHGNIQIRHGNSGGPLVDNDGKVVGVSVYQKDESNAFFIPSTDVKNFLNEQKPKFNFNYEYKYSDEWPKQFVQSFNQSPLLTTGMTATLGGGAAYLGYRGLSNVGRLGNGLSVGVAAYGGLGLIEDVPSLLNANNNRDFLKAGLNTLGDSSLLAGGLARTWMGVGTREVSAGLLSGAESKLASTVGAGLLGSGERYLTSAGKVGLILIAAGITAKLASDLIPNRLVKTGVQRTDGTDKPIFSLLGK